MNLLKVITKPTSLADTFIVYWTNKWVPSSKLNAPKGAVLVEVPSDIEDKLVVAELFALQHLLEVKEVIGQNIAGHPNITLIVSQGSCKKLRSKKSAKDHLVKFANFLQSRFYESPLKVEKDDSWLAGNSIEPVDRIVASYEACGEKLQFSGVGEVNVTAHVVERFAERMTAEKNQDYADRVERNPSATHSVPNPVGIGEAWRTIRQLVSFDGIKEITVGSRFSKIKHQDEGRQYYHPKGWVFVVTNSGFKGLKLATVYKHSPK